MKRTANEWLEFWRDCWSKSEAPRHRIWTPDRTDMLAVFAERVRREALNDSVVIRDFTATINRWREEFDECDRMWRMNTDVLKQRIAELEGHTLRDEVSK